MPLSLLLDLLSSPLLRPNALYMAASNLFCLASPIGAAGMATMALAPRAAAIPVLIGGQAVFGLGIALFNLQSLSLRQAITPSGLLGRANAVVRLVGWGSSRSARHWVGWLGGVIGLREVLVVCAVGSLLTTALPLLSAVRSVRQTPDPEPVWVLRAASPG